jgi:hypothetical protein
VGAQGNWLIFNDALSQGPHCTWRSSRNFQMLAHIIGNRNALWVSRREIMQREVSYSIKWNSWSSLYVIDNAWRGLHCEEWGHHARRHTGIGVPHIALLNVKAQGRILAAIYDWLRNMMRFKIRGVQYAKHEYLTLQREFRPRSLRLWKALLPLSSLP